EDSLEGNSFADLTRSPNASSMDRAIYAEMKPWCMIRYGAFKLVADKEPFTLTHLFDLESDPYELNNLLGHADHVDAQRKLATKLESWWQRVSS
ncbi:MAG TPA: hypothetical protein DHW45_21310, partial [Candidatus Latescibacteria bacterium]|nr:hypothetical protein [Candidatus Latescibacterota bacterium]